MATFDLTSKATVGVDSNSVAVPPSRFQGFGMYMREAVLDIEKMVEDGYSCTNGDVFQVLEIPANTMVLFAGAQILKSFNGSSPTVDIDFAEGDDIVDGADVTATAGTFLASGSNGAAMTTSGTITFTQHVTTTDTIDVVLAASSADVTEGKLRVMACCIETGIRGGVAATEVDRDLLA